MTTKVQVTLPNRPEIMVDFTQSSQLTLTYGSVESIPAGELRPGDLVSAHGYADSLDWLTVAAPEPCHNCGSECVALSFVDDAVSRAYLAVVPDLDADHYSPGELLVARRLIGGAW